MIIRSSYLLNQISYPGKLVSSCLRRPLNVKTQESLTTSAWTVHHIHMSIIRLSFCDGNSHVHSGELWFWNNPHVFIANSILRFQLIYEIIFLVEMMRVIRSSYVHNEITYFFGEHNIFKFPVFMKTSHPSLLTYSTISLNYTKT